MTARLDPPQHFDDERRQIWAETVTRLTSSGRVFRADPEVLGTYVEAVRSHRQASRLLAQTNVMITRDGNAMENPALAIQRKSAEAMARASRALGLNWAPMPGEPAMTPAIPAASHDGKCGARKKQTEGTCTQAAGWGTPHPGTGRCKLHGGCVPSSVAAGLNAQAARELARLDVPPVVDALSELARLACEAVAWKDNMAAKVNELTGIRYESQTGGEQLRAEIALWERALDRCIATLTAMAKLNIEERLAGIRKQTADMLERALDAALQKSGADLAGQAAAREEFKRRLRVVAEARAAMTVTAPDDADLAVLGEFERRLEDAPVDPRTVWRRTARPEQLLPTETGWRVCYWQGGRGAGKNASCSNAMADWVLSDTDGEGEYGIIGPTYADAWTKCVEGKTGILRALGTSMAEIKDHRSKTVKAAWRTYGQVVMHNGIIIYVDSAAEGGLRVQGRNLKGAWCSEIGLWDKWEMAWKESVNYAVRDGRSQIIADGTPKASRKARKLIRSLIRDDPEHGGVIIRKLRTRDNIANLSEAFVRAVVGGFRGTRLERQELEGELLDDVANALWTRDLLDSIKVPGVGQPGGPPYLLKTYIGVDPSDGSEDSDEQAYTVIGKGNPEDRHLYVAESWGGQESPAPFAKRVIRKAIEWNATVVVEKNHGGKWLTEVFRQAQKDMGVSVRVETVHASDAKRARAEPVAVMYDRYSEDGRPLVLHCHRTWKDDDGHVQVDEHMPELEDCMATFTGAAGEKSPDRLDSLVWGASKFLRESFGPPGKAGPRKWAGSQDLDRAAATEDSLMRRRLRGAHGGLLGGKQETPADAPWDLDGFGPQDDDKHPEHGHRGNVRAWR